MSWIDPPPPRPATAGATAAAEGRSPGDRPGDTTRAGQQGWTTLALLAVIAGVLAFALGLTHLLPGVAYWDTGEMQTVGPVFGTAHPTGYPSYVVVGWLASVLLQPLGSPALAMNLLSAILLGGAAASTTLLAGRLTGRPILAVAGGAVVAVMPETRYLATHADPHALHALLVVVVVLLLVVWGDRRRAGRPRTDRWLVAAAIVYGFALGNQALALFLAPGIALYVLATDPRIVLRPRMILGCAAAVAGTTAAVYLQLPLAVLLGRPLIYGAPGTWDGFLYVVLGEQFRGSLGNPLANPSTTLHAMANAVSGELGAVALATIPAALVVAFRKPRYALLTVPAVAITLVFAAVYENAEIARYYVGPAILVLTWIVVAAAWVADLAESAVRRARAVDRSLAAAAGAAVSVTLAVAIVAFPVARIPDTEGRVRYVEVLDARSYVDEAFRAFAQDATVVSWWRYSTPLWYGTIVEGRRPDLRVVDDRTRLDEGLGSVADVIRAALPTRPVYVIQGAVEIRKLQEGFVLEPVFAPADTVVYRVVSEKGAAP